MDRLLQFLGRLKFWQLFVGFCIPALIVGVVASQWFGDTAMWVLFFTVPTVSFLIFFGVPVALALRAGNGKQALLAAAIAAGVLSIIGIGYLTSH